MAEQDRAFSKRALYVRGGVPKCTNMNGIMILMLGDFYLVVNWAPIADRALAAEFLSDISGMGLLTQLIKWSTCTKSQMNRGKGELYSAFKLI